MTAATAPALQPRPRAFAPAREFGAAVVTIMVKELRSRMRGRRAFVVLTVYLLLLAAITYAIYQATYQTVQSMAAFGGSTVNVSVTIGQAIFTTLSLLQLLLIAFIGPAFTAGAISVEREKQTLDLLITTPLRPGAIVVGKLLAALAFVFLLILASVPLSAIVLMYGGAAIDDIVRQIVVLFAAAIGFGSIGLFFSALVKRTQAATVLTYCAMLALTLGTGFIYILWGVMSATAPQNAFGVIAPNRPPEAVLYFNPFIAMADVVAHTEQPGAGGFSTVMSGIRGVDEFGNVNGGDQFVEVPECAPGGPCPIPDMVGGGGAFPAPVAQQPTVAGYFWPRFVVTIGIVSILLTLWSMRLVAPARLRRSFRRGRAAGWTSS